jgi:hypothetical protein
MKNQLPYESTGSAIKGYSDSVTARRETNDCVVRAFASAFDVTYDCAHKYVAEQFGRKPRKGTYYTASRMTKLSEGVLKVNSKKIIPIGTKSNSVAYPYSLSYEVKVKGEKVKRQMTVGTFVKKNPKGTFFILVRGHAFTIKDGVVIGNPEDAIKTKRPMRSAFQIK